MNEEKLFKLIRVTEQRNRLITHQVCYFISALVCMLNSFFMKDLHWLFTVGLVIAFFIGFGFTSRSFFRVQMEIEKEFGKIKKKYPNHPSIDCDCPSCRYATELQTSGGSRP